MTKLLQKIASWQTWKELLRRSMKQERYNLSAVLVSCRFYFIL